MNPLWSTVVPWSAFHLSSPDKTSDALGPQAQQSASLLHLFTNFSSWATRHIGAVRDGYFQQLDDVVLFEQDDGSLSPLEIPRGFDRVVYTKATPFVFNVVAVSQTGACEAATIWMQDDQVEVFLRAGDVSDDILAQINSVLVPAIRRQWSSRIRVLVYNLETLETLPQSVLWNVYFVFVRMVLSSRKTLEVFSPASREAFSSLLHKRDSVFQAIGRLIALCVKQTGVGRVSRKEYDRTFGERAEPVRLSQEIVMRFIPSRMNSCSNGASPLWSVLSDVIPNNIGDAPRSDRLEGDWEEMSPVDQEKWSAFMAPPSAPSMVFRF